MLVCVPKAEEDLPLTRGKSEKQTGQRSSPRNRAAWNGLPFSELRWHLCVQSAAYHLCLQITWKSTCVTNMTPSKQMILFKRMVMFSVPYVPLTLPGNIRCKVQATLCCNIRDTVDT